ncbi:N-acetylmuramoyl-L-alanine amidase [Arcobacter sp. CECT 8985]|uniref:N-acetylmuramoyl-L-alanine amidase n=1 Tax=Arcobacter sp. CECT 8985 TaxID=1935424 RepID=UPI00100C0AB6|nr:N-acetylmuramoyl-L-alanine amidase [Arcobacter sp. CECT 8985]RXJ86966.1 hypothetical protein CRU93_06175 [Arcobacter sp. CECT 8985]
MKRIALVVGHSEKSKGAYNDEMNVHEYYLNEALAKHTLNVMKIEKDLDPFLVYRKNGYSKLPGDINETNPDMIICFHHNASANKTVQGTETLYYHKAERSKEFAKEIQKNLVDVLDFRDRGLKPVDSEDRGGYVLKYTNAPCVLIEPYFISDNDGLIMGAAKQFECASAIAAAVKKVLDS